MAADSLMELFESSGGSAGGRVEAIRRYAFALLDAPALEAIVAWAPQGVVEIGAGTGYWAARLADQGADVVAYDAAPAPTGRNKWFTSGEQWFPVEQGDERAVDSHEERCLLLVWPTKDEDWPANAVTRFHDAGGERVVFVGEGPGGRTGDDRLHRMLGQIDRCYHCAYGLADSACVREVPQLFKVERRVRIPTWDGFDDELVLLRRHQMRTRAAGSSQRESVGSVAKASWNSSRLRTMLARNSAGE